jgi:hypothetical protein
MHTDLRITTSPVLADCIHADHRRHRECCEHHKISADLFSTTSVPGGGSGGGRQAAAEKGLLRQAGSSEGESNSDNAGANALGGSYVRQPRMHCLPQRVGLEVHFLHRRACGPGHQLVRAPRATAHYFNPTASSKISCRMRLASRRSGIASASRPHTPSLCSASRNSSKPPSDD